MDASGFCLACAALQISVAQAMMHIKYDQNPKMQMLPYDEHTFWLTNNRETYDCVSLFGSAVEIKW